MAYTIDIALVNQLAAKNDYEDVPFGNSVEHVWTLDTFLSQWAAGVITMPAALAGADPVSEAYAVATDRCTAVPTSDCSKAAALAQSYGQQVLNAWTAGGYSASAPAASPASTATAAAAAPVAVSSAPAATAPAAPAAATTPAAPAIAATPAAALQVPVTGMHAQFISGGGDAGTVATGVGLAVSGAVSFGISLAIAAIAAFFSSIFGGGGDVNKLADALNQLKQATEQALDQTTRFAWQIGDGLGATWLAIANIWDNFLDAIWTYMKQLWQLLWTIVSSVLPKIINALRDLRKLVDTIYQKYIQPVMKYLQRVRVIVEILKALHVPFAAKLDRILSQIQAALYAPFLYLLGSVRGLAQWYNVLLTADLLIQRPIFLRTMWAYQADWIAMWWAAQTVPSGTPAPQLQPAPDTSAGRALILGEQDLYATTGAGPMAALVAQAQAMTEATAAGA